MLATCIYTFTKSIQIIQLLSIWASPIKTVVLLRKVISVLVPNPEVFLTMIFYLYVVLNFNIDVVFASLNNNIK